MSRYPCTTQEARIPQLHDLTPYTVVVVSNEDELLSLELVESSYATALENHYAQLGFNTARELYQC